MFIILLGSCHQGTFIDIGFTSKEFLNAITVCFDESESRSVYAFHTVPREITARDTNNGRPSFRPDGYFPFDVDEAYKQVWQRSFGLIRQFCSCLFQVSQAETILDLTGRDDYISSGSSYLARGHLSPNSDFVFYSWQVLNLTV